MLENWIQDNVIATEDKILKNCWIKDLSSNGPVFMDIQKPDTLNQTNDL